MNDWEDTEIVQRRTARLSKLLESLDPSEQEVQASARAIRAQMNRPRPSMLWKAAAVIALLLLGTLAVPQARAWIASVFGIGETAVVTDPRPAAPATPAQVSVTFAAERDTFDVQLMQADAQLILEQSDNGTASATGPAAASFVVFPSTLRIDGPADATYRIKLPARVSTVRVLHPDGRTTLHSNF